MAKQKHVHSLTPNQKAYNKEVERLKRFGRLHKVNVQIPDRPDRITKQALDKIKNLKGKDILAISTVDVTKDIDTGERLQTPETVNALDLYEQYVGDKPFSAGERQFDSLTRFYDNIEQDNGKDYNEKLLDTFETNLRQYRQTFRDIMGEWKDKMIERLGLKTFLDTLQNFEQEFGGIGKAQAYNFDQLTQWLNRFAERIDDPDVRQAALNEVEEIQSNSMLRQEFDDYKKFRRKSHYKRYYK